MDSQCRAEKESIAAENWHPLIVMIPEMLLTAGPDGLQRVVVMAARQELGKKRSPPPRPRPEFLGKICSVKPSPPLCGVPGTDSLVVGPSLAQP